MIKHYSLSNCRQFLGRKSFTDTEFCDLICERNEHMDAIVNRLKYHPMNNQDYVKLRDELPDANTTIFYFSTAPDLFHIMRFKCWTLFW